MRKALLLLFLVANSLICSKASQAQTPPLPMSVVVVDERQSPIPNASITLEQNGRVVSSGSTDVTGTWQFSVPAGDYTLTVEKSGFELYRNPAFRSDPQKSTSEAVTLKVSGVSADVVVADRSDDAGTVQAGATTPAATVGRAAAERLPLATRRVDETIPLVPGVIRSANGEISINGAAEQQSAFRVNGMNATDPVTGTFRLNLPVDAVENVKVFRHPYSAEFGQFTGGLTEIETRRGGDKWHFSVNDFFPDFRFHDGRFHGLQDVSPHLNFNGPLIAKKLFLNQSLGYSILKAPVRGLIYPNNESVSESVSSFTQLDAILSEKHSASLSLGYFPERNQYVGLDFFRPRPVTPNKKQRDGVIALNDKYSIAGGLLDSRISYKRLIAAVWGQGTADQILTPTGERGNYFRTELRSSSRLELGEFFEFAPARLFKTDHTVKMGINFTHASNRENFSARPIVVARSDGTPIERTVFDHTPQFTIDYRAYSFFVQDHWLIRQNFSLDFGLRLEDQGFAHERNFAPRVGFAWSPFKGDKTIVRGGIGHFNDRVPLNIRAFTNYPARTVTSFGPDGTTIISTRRIGNVLVGDLRGTASSSSGRGLVPQNLTWNVQVDQVVNSRLSLRFGYSNSRTDHLYIVAPESNDNGPQAIVVSPTGKSNYYSFEVTAKLTLPKRQVFYISYVHSRARGDLNDFNSYYGEFGIPLVRQNQFSKLPTDVPNRLLAWGSLTLPKKITISTITEYRSGFPYSVVDQRQNFVGTRNTMRFPNYFSIDGEISKDFKITKKYAIRLSLRGFNLTDHFNPRNVRNNIDGPDFGTFLNSYRRFFNGGIDIIF